MVHPVHLKPADIVPVIGSRPLSILVIDDHALVCHGLALSLQEIFPGCRVTQASTLGQAMRIVQEGGGPDLVLQDLHLPDTVGFEGVAAMAKAVAPAPVVVVSATLSDNHVAGCLAAGARGALPKAGSIDLLRHALGLTLVGEVFIPWLRGSAPEPSCPLFGSALPVERFTPRQRDIFDLLVTGRSNKEIARELGILEGTVKVHVRAIMQKLGARNRTEVAALAARVHPVNGGVLRPGERVLKS